MRLSELKVGDQFTLPENCHNPPCRFSVSGELVRHTEYGALCRSTEVLFLCTLHLTGKSRGSWRATFWGDSEVRIDYLVNALTETFNAPV